MGRGLDACLVMKTCQLQSIFKSDLKGGAACVAEWGLLFVEWLHCCNTQPGPSLAQVFWTVGFCWQSTRLSQIVQTKQTQKNMLVLQSCFRSKKSQTKIGCRVTWGLMVGYRTPSCLMQVTKEMFQVNWVKPFLEPRCLVVLCPVSEVHIISMV